MSSKKEISSGAEKAEKLTSKNNTAENKQSKTATTVKESTSENKGAGTATKNKGASATKNATESKNNAQKAVREAKVQTKTAANAPTQKGKIKAEGAKLSAADEKKLKAEQIKAERKQKRLEKKLAYKEKLNARAAALKEKREQRKAEREERKNKMRAQDKKALAQQKKQERLARIEANNAKREARLAKMRAEREHKQKLRAEKRAEQREKKRVPGFGGWLAAVISLGAATLVLGTVLTFGWIGMDGMRADMAGSQTQSVYELNSVIDNLDGNLAKARVANSVKDRTKILADIAIECEMAEIILERMPMECNVTEKATSFVNKMGDSAKNMLYKVAAGEKLSASDEKSIEYMYETNLKIKRALNEMTGKMTEKDIMAMLKGKKDCILIDTFGDLQNNAIELPKEIQDGPFSSSIEKVSAKNLEGMKDITAPQAEELAKKYFKDFKIKDAKCTGEASAKELELYNVTLTLEDDSEMLAQISKKGGKVVLFDSYKECKDKNFSVERCIDIAEDFLEDLGYDDLEAVWVSENGTTCNLNFVYEANDDVIVYPDMIKVKVCEERGMVTGVEALGYVLNHTNRDITNAKISKKDARTSISQSVNIKDERLAIIPFEGAERLAWEFVGNTNGHEYYIYVDAQTGEELEVLIVVGTKQGRALM